MTAYGRISNKTSSIINPAEAIAANYTYAPRVHVSQAAQKATDATEKATDAVNDEKKPLDAKVADAAETKGVAQAEEATKVAEDLKSQRKTRKEATQIKNNEFQETEGRKYSERMEAEAAEDMKRKAKALLAATGVAILGFLAYKRSIMGHRKGAKLPKVSRK